MFSLYLYSNHLDRTVGLDVGGKLKSEFCCELIQPFLMHCTIQSLQYYIFSIIEGPLTQFTS